MAQASLPTRSQRLLAWSDWLGDKRQPLVVVVVSAALVTGVGIALAFGAGLVTVLRRLEHIDPLWLLVCLGAEMLAYAGYVFAFRETARVDGGPELGYRETARIVAAGFGAFFADSASGGFRLDYLALRHAGASRRQARARVFGLTALEYVVLAPAAMVAALILYFGETFERPALTLPWLAVVPGFALAIWLSSPRRAHRFAPSDDHGALRRAAAHAIAGLRVVRGLIAQPFRHGMGVGGAALYWFGDIVCLWGALQAFGSHIDVLRVLVAYATGYVVSRRGLPAGGAGAAEALLTIAFVWFGVPFSTALLAVFGYRLFNFWLALVPALLVHPSVVHLRRERHRAVGKAA